MMALYVSKFISSNFSAKMRWTFGTFSIRYMNSSHFHEELNHKSPDSMRMPNNISLLRCSPMPLVSTHVQSMTIPPYAMPKRPLLILLPWILAEEKHLQKFRHLWFRKGFDVLTMRTSPFDFIFPPIGAKVIAKNLLEYMNQMSPQYNEIVVHAFSVGVYQFGEILVKMESDHNQYDGIADSIRGVIIDSIVHVEEAPSGMSRAITENSLIQPLLEGSFKIFYSSFDRIITKNYRAASNALFNNYLRCPSMLLVSHNDAVSEMSKNKQLIESWKSHGMNVQFKCWNDSNHVLHYHDHPYEYEQQLDVFLKKLKLKNITVF